ncbi:MAG TPA: hypothetical protein VFU82_08035 [Gammaproteobacteria bacterium]|nr:hypothetical protein [Gammaproteobacteria bacterium]
MPKSEDSRDIESGTEARSESARPVALTAFYYTLLGALSILVSTPTAANAAAGAADIEPNKLIDAFGNFSTSDKAWTVIDGGSSLIVNAVVFFDFALQLSSIFNGISNKLTKSLAEKTIFSAVMLFALCSATAAFGLGEDNFAYLIDDVWLLPALAFALSTFVTRSTALDSIMTRMRNTRNEDSKKQAQFAFALKRLSPEAKQTIIETYNKTRDNYLEKTKNPNYSDLASEFLQAFNVTHNSSTSFQKISSAKKGLSLFGTGFDCLAAPTAAIPTGIVFAQKGYGGFNDIAKLCNSLALNDLPQAKQFPFGIGSGVASAALYARAYDYRHTLTDLWTHIRASETIKKRLFHAINAAFIFLLNIPASKSGQNMAQTMIDNPHSWVYPWFPHDGLANQTNTSSGSSESSESQYQPWQALAFIMLCQLGVFIVNSKSCIEVLITRPQHSPTKHTDFETFVRKIANPVGRIIKDGDDGDALREQMDTFIECFEKRQNKTAVNSNHSPLLREVSGISSNLFGRPSGTARSSGLHNNPEAGPLDQTHPNRSMPNVGADTTEISTLLRRPSSNN